MSVLFIIVCVMVLSWAIGRFITKVAMNLMPYSGVIGNLIFLPFLVIAPWSTLIAFIILHLVGFLMMVTVICLNSGGKIGAVDILVAIKSYLIAIMQSFTIAPVSK